MNQKPYENKPRQNVEYEVEQICVIKRCPSCGERLFDKFTPTSGTIRLKCSNCHRLVRVNLAFRRCPHHSR